MQISTDNTHIYNLLENADQLFPDFNSDHAVAFDLEDDFNVVLYTSESRNFVSYIAENYLQQADELPALIQLVQDFPDPGCSTFLLNEAIRLIEDKLHSKNNSRFYFDAH
ncbi:MAG: hypothetical protein JWP12_1161 [Bacteroidetes bacterium]|nr:hypothetical protein [Bacteroidota bacterium]